MFLRINNIASDKRDDPTMFVKRHLLAAANTAMLLIPGKIPGVLRTNSNQPTRQPAVCLEANPPQLCREVPAPGVHGLSELPVTAEAHGASGECAESLGAVVVGVSKAPLVSRALFQCQGGTEFQC